MPACLRRLGHTTIQAFRQALAIVGLQAPLFLTQNDGTLMSATYAEQYPVLTFASGPTNSMRGAAFLTGVADAMVIAAGLAAFGERRFLHGLEPTFIQRCVDAMGQMIADSVDRMKISAAPVPLIAVGGGSFLVPDIVPGIAQVMRAPHYAVANAVGAAIAQISGEVDYTVTLGTRSRDEALAQAKALALERAITAGAHPHTVEVVDVEEIPLTYLPSNALRLRVKAVGDLDLTG